VGLDRLAELPFGPYLAVGHDGANPRGYLRQRVADVDALLGQPAPEWPGVGDGDVPGVGEPQRSRD